MRLFIAINFPDQIKRKILKQIEDLKSQFPQVSWVKSENLHLTLKFLGYVKEERLEEIKKGIETVSRDFKPFELTISKMGYFHREPFIIRLNINDSTTLNDLVERLEKEMGKLGFKRENRPYTPHITLGRGRKLKREEVVSIKKEIDESAVFFPIKFTVNKIALMESQLKPTGANYTLLYQFPLN